MGWVISLTILLCVIIAKPHDATTYMVASGLFAIAGSIGLIGTGCKQVLIEALKEDKEKTR